MCVHIHMYAHGVCAFYSLEQSERIVYSRFSKYLKKKDIARRELVVYRDLCVTSYESHYMYTLLYVWALVFCWLKLIIIRRRKSSFTSIRSYCLFLLRTLMCLRTQFSTFILNGLCVRTHTHTSIACARLDMYSISRSWKTKTSETPKPLLKKIEANEE